ncbi:MAG TPA: phosphoribosyltransferase family protein [Patescibacteria group bacterium]|nr:phosphoribosyltransferase family protein [Patescibacteria group bacterium]
MFEDRQQAGFLLAQKLEQFADKKDVLVLGLARGGVVVAKVISTFLNVPFDALVIKKIGLPRNPELAIGAVGPKNTVFWNEELIERLRISKEEKEKLKVLKSVERNVQENALRGNKPLEISGKTVILVDDGVATGASVLAAWKFLKKEEAKRVILAVPVIASDTLRDIKKYFDMIIALKIKRNFYAVGEFYKNFPQVENEEVVRLLK